MKVFRGKPESACLSIHVSVCQSVCVQNTSVYESTGGGIKSHLVTALVPKIFVELACGEQNSVFVGMRWCVLPDLSGLELLLYIYAWISK